MHIERETTCVCKGEREREREERERFNIRFEHCHNFRQLLCSPLTLISVGPGELHSDRIGEGEPEEKESFL